MKLSEFKAWLDGFSEAMGEAPTPEQWAKIKAKLDSIRESNVDWSKVIPQPYPERKYGDPLRLYGPDIQFGNPIPNGLGTVICGDPPGSMRSGGTA